jgi:hypothetical protein
MGSCDGKFKYVFFAALYSNPDVDMLDLRRKLGFVKLAIRYGVSLVPVYTFNEGTCAVCG